MYVGLVQHLLKHPRIPMQWHRLVAIGEVAVVTSCADRDSSCNGRVELRRVQPPLLACVVAEKLVIQIPPNTADDYVFRGLDLRTLFCDLAQEFIDLQAVEIQTVQLIERVSIDGHRNKLPVDAGENSVFIWTPRCEAGKIIEDAFRVCVEDVWPVFVNKNAVIVV